VVGFNSCCKTPFRDAVWQLPIHVACTRGIECGQLIPRLSSLRSVVAAARTLIMSDAHQTRTVGEPLPANPEAVRAALDGIAADAARFRQRRGAGDGEQERGREPEDPQSGQQPMLNWGPEGEEGPLLSIGETFCACSCSLL